MEEERRYVANLNDVPEEDEDYLKARSCVLAISVGGDAYEGKKFRATMKMIGLRFKECAICICDTLQRHNIAAKDPLQRSPEEFYEYSKKLGSEWLERNLSTIQEELKIPFKIVRWDDYLNHPKFKSHSEEINDLFKKNQEYRDIIQNTAKDFLTRNIDKLNINISPDRFCKLSEEYLLEECAAFLEWLDHKYDYEIYYSPREDLLRKSLELLRPGSNLIGRRLEVNFEKTLKDKEIPETDLYRLALENVMEIIPEHIYWKDIHGSYLGCNLDQAKDHFTNEDGQVLVIGRSDFHYFDYKTAMVVRNNDLYVIKNNKKIIIEETAPVDGKDHIYLSYKQPLRDKDGNIIGIIGVSVDITEKKRQEQEIITKNALLKEALAAKQALLDNVSNEIMSIIK